MRRNLISTVIAFVVLLVGMLALHGQTKALSEGAKAQPVGIPDLSGNWLGGGATFSTTDPGGTLAGTSQDDTPY